MNRLSIRVIYIATLISPPLSLSFFLSFSLSLTHSLTHSLTLSLSLSLFLYFSLSLCLCWFYKSKYVNFVSTNGQVVTIGSYSLPNSDIASRCVCMSFSFFNIAFKSLSLPSLSLSMRFYCLLLSTTFCICISLTIPPSYLTLFKHIFCSVAAPAPAAQHTWP